MAGTPGFADPKLLPDPGAIVVNEVLPKSSDGRNDLIELHNTTDQDIDIGNWFIGDSDAEVDRLIYLTRYRIAPGTVLPAHGYLVFSREEHFGNPSDEGVNYPFGLSSLWRSGSFDRRRQIRANARLFRLGLLRRGAVGRVLWQTVDTADGSSVFRRAQHRHRSVNRTEPIRWWAQWSLIKSCFIRPTMSTNTFESSIQGWTPSTCPSGSAPWQLSGAVRFVFEDDSRLQPGQHALIVADRPQVFRERLGVPDSVPIFGPFEGKLNNGGPMMSDSIAT